MSARRATQILIVSLATVALFAMPAAANAGTDTKVSSVDAVSADVAPDGKGESTSPTTSSDAKDSPTVTSYGGGDDSVPPPTDCDTPDSDSSSSSSSSTSSGSGDSGVDTSCTVIVECSAADTDGKDATGAPCVTETCTEGGGTATDGTVCGGGEVPPTEEQLPPVDGGGAPEPVETIGGGGPELPFTGLPLHYVIYFGIALVLMGAALWIRARFGSDQA